MKTILLSQGLFAEVDDEDYEWLSRWKWSAQERKSTFYVVRTQNRKTIQMHREIVGALSGEEVDHKDGNGLNNQRRNLRKCTTAQNQANAKIRTDNTSGVKGVSSIYNKYWKAEIKHRGERIYLGTFKNKDDAIRARKEAEKKYHGEFARTN